MRKEERESKYDYYDIFSIFENGDDGQEEAGRWLVVVSDSICKLPTPFSLITTHYRLYIPPFLIAFFSLQMERYS